MQHMVGKKDSMELGDGELTLDNLPSPGSADEALQWM